MKYIPKLIVIFSLFLSSCNTTELWSNKPSRFNTSEDTIKEFMISEDGRKIVVLGKKYHYIFDDESGEIKKLLAWIGRPKLKMIIYDFELLSSSKIEGPVLITSLDSKELAERKIKPLSANELEFLKNLDFEILPVGEYNIPHKKFNLVGTRYLPKPGVNYKTGSSLNKQYEIRIINNSFSNKAEKIALTPVTVAEDGLTLAAGVVALGMVVVAAAVIMPIAIVTCTVHPKAACY